MMACRAENSFTHRHLCEFTGLDFEMAINEHYSEVMDVIDKLFVYIFTGLNAKYGKALCSFDCAAFGGITCNDLTTCFAVHLRGSAIYHSCMAVDDDSCSSLTATL